MKKKQQPLKLNAFFIMVAGLRARALGLLARREHSRQELVNKLQRHADNEEIELVLDVLAEEGLQSDLRFTEQYIRSAISKGYGRCKIIASLRHKGINESLARQYLVEDNHFWQQVMTEVWQKKWQDCDLASSKIYARCFRFYLQRGFAAENIHRFLSAVKNSF